MVESDGGENGLSQVFGGRGLAIGQGWEHAVAREKERERAGGYVQCKERVRDICGVVCALVDVHG